MKQEEIYAFLKEMGEYFRKKAVRSDEDREKWSSYNNSRICKEIAENHFRDPTKKVSTTEPSSAVIRKNLTTDPRPDAIRFFQKICAAYDLEATGLPMTCPPWQDLAKPYFMAMQSRELLANLYGIFLQADKDGDAFLNRELAEKIEANLTGNHFGNITELVGGKVQ